ncbi:MAG: hypothetical protein HY904_20950 [Deltaproteobacteria bacterium]|nr:hypothetical protein [Deltaproteobacteria bacterium]
MPWIPRDEDDARDALTRRQRDRRSILGPVVFSTVASAIAALMSVAGVHVSRRHVGPGPRADLTSRTGALSLLAVWVLLTAILVFRKRRDGSMFGMEKDGWVCRSCGVFQTADAATPCACGGAFERVELFRWVD